MASNPYTFTPYKFNGGATTGSPTFQTPTLTTVTNPTAAALQKQKENLEKRLAAAGEKSDDRNVIEKALNLDQGQGFLMDFFEVLDRPGQMVKSALMNEDNALKGAWEGISGQTDIRGAEFAQDFLKMEEPDTKVGKFIMDVGVDILTDPLTYIPAGLLTKGLFGSTKYTTEMVEATAALTKNTQIMEETAKSIALRTGLTDFADEAFQTAFRTELLAQGVDYRTTSMLTDPLKFSHATDNKRLIRTSARSKKVSQSTLLEEQVGNAVSEMFDVMPEDSVLKGAKVYLGSGSDAGALKALDQGKEAVLKDIEIRMPTQFNGEVVISKVEVKNVAKDFQAATLNFRIKDGSVNIVGDFRLTRGEDAAKIIEDIFNDETIKTTLMRSNLVKKSAKAGETIEVTIGKITKAIKSGDEKTIAEAIEFLSKEGTKKGSILAMRPELIDQIYSVLKTSYLGEDLKYIHYMHKGKMIVMDADEVLTKVLQDGIRFNPGKGKKGLTGSVRMQPNYRMNQTQFEKILNATDDTSQRWLSDVMSEYDNAFKTQTEIIQEATEASTKVVATKKAGLLSKMKVFVGDMTPQGVKDAMKPVNDVIQNFGFNFNSQKTFSKDFVDKLLSIEGVNGTRLQANGRRISSLTNDVIAAFPGNEQQALKTLNTIIESGATVNADGTIKYLDNLWEPQELADAIIQQVDGGFDTLVLGFSDELTAKNASKTLNSLTSYNGAPDDIFEVVTKGGRSTLKITGGYDPKTLKDFLVGIDTYAGGQKISLGVNKLDGATETILRDNADLIGSYTKIRDDMVDILVNEIGFENLPKELTGKLGYMKHVLSPESKEGLKTLQQGVRSKFFKGGTDVYKGRKFIGTVDEVNDIFKEFYDMPVDLFDNNAHRSMETLIRTTMEKAEQTQMVELVMGGTDNTGTAFFKVVDNTKEAVDGLPPKFRVMADDLTAEFPEMFKGLPEGMQKEMKDRLLDMGYGDGKALAMNKSAYGVLERVNKAYIDLPTFVKGYDKFMNAWKSVTLVSPGFHMRNLFGNMSNMYLVGMDTASQIRYSGRVSMQLSDYKRVGKLLAEGNLLDDILKQSPEAVENYKSVLKFYESGVAQTHKGVRDLDSVKVMLDSKGNKNILDKVVKTNFDVAEGMDDFQRLSLYQWAYDSEMKKGASEIVARAKASDKVRNSLFDYSNLTKTERDYMKRMFPFYTFMKNNLVFQMKNVVDNPGAYGRIGRAYNYATEDLTGITNEDMPAYMSENMWLPIPWKVRKNDKEAIAFLKLNLPVSDFTEFVENPFKKGVTSVTAPVKLLWELGTGIDSFTGAAIKDFPGQKNRLESGTGVLSGIRDAKGNLALSSDPYIQKLANDLGLRVPKNYASMLLDAADTAGGYQTGLEGGADIGGRTGVFGISTQEKLDLTKLYQDLEKLRNTKSIYEQTYGQPLPTLFELGLD